MSLPSPTNSMSRVNRHLIGQPGQQSGLLLWRHLSQEFSSSPFVFESVRSYCLRNAKPSGISFVSRHPSRSITSLSSRFSSPQTRPSLSSQFSSAQNGQSYRTSQRSRGLSTQASNLNASFEPAKEGLARLPSRRLISLSGPDASKFLQGLITNNVDKNRESPFYAAFLDARGRVLWDVFVWAYPELAAKEGDWACNIEVDGGELEALLKHLKRHKLRSKISIKIVEEAEMGVWAGWGLSSTESIQGERVVASMVDPRGDSFGMRYLFKGNQPLEDLSVPVVHTDQYHLRRYHFGIPEGPSEIPREAALPMEYNIDLSQGIDFKKGCYVGQELTIRTKHTGVVRKRVLPLVLKPITSSDGHDTTTSSHKLPEPGTDIKQLDDDMGLKKGRAAGKFIAGMGNRGLGLARLEMMTSMRVSAEGGSWKPDTKFGVHVGNDEVMEVEALAAVEFRKRVWDLWDKNRTRV